MLEGEIIKFYRNKAGLTQEQLGKGICSSKHVGKIEQGQTSYSSEIITFLTERLHIDMQKEVTNFKQLEKKLHCWHTSIIKNNMSDVEKIKKELENSPFIKSSKYAPLYQLLQARYYILKKDSEKTYEILQKVETDQSNLPPYETNLLRHVWSIYYISNYITTSIKNYQKSIKSLHKINEDEYKNSEYFYHLAVSYNFIGSSANAYAYAEKALRHFKETNNYLRAIDAESLMLLQIGNEIHIDLKELTESYLSLIHDCEVLHAPEKKGILLSNLGYEYFKRKDFDQAYKYYKEALHKVDKPSLLYLQRLYNYLECSLEGKQLRKTVLLKKAQEGRSMAKSLNNLLFKTLYKLLIFRIEGEIDQYYNFMEKDALPYIKAHSHTLWINIFAKQLYTYYMEKEQYEKAAKTSKIFADHVS